MVKLIRLKWVNDGPIHNIYHDYTIYYAGSSYVNQDYFEQLLYIYVFNIKNTTR